MERYGFNFLEKDSIELLELSKKIDELIYKDSNSSIITGRLFAEKLLAEVIEKEDESYLNSHGYKQYDKIKELAKMGLLPEFIERAFDNVRIIGNKAVHEGRNNDLEFAIKVHKNLYVLAKWFVETYGSDYELEVPEYTIPEYRIDEGLISVEKIEEKLEEKVKKYIETLNKRSIAEEKGIKRREFESEDEEKSVEAAMSVLGYEYEDEILKEEEAIATHNLACNEEYTFKKSKGSYLLNELEKLSDSSQEAVESASSLDVFKKYLHVDRSIQTTLREGFFKAYRAEGAQILLICGSVGDGKSHLLAYLHEQHPEEFQKFKIHNDATESFSPNLNEIETLEKVLESFKDENIENSSEKLILAINLGVLHNFLETKETKEKFSKFYSFINESGIFEEKVSESTFEKENFRLVSFGDYSIYKLTSNGAKSDYIEGLLNKIVAESDENPFFKGYKMDKEEEITSPVIDNYEILKLEGVTEKISNLLIYIMVKYKRLISTREILNFIYEILVPANISEFDLGSTDIEYIKASLPNLLFGTLTRGPLLGLISSEDPIKCRDKELDKLLININIATDIGETLREVIDIKKMRGLEGEISLIENFNSVTETIKCQIVETIIRAMYLFGEDRYKKIFEDREYKEYIKYLYYYNKGDVENYLPIFEEVKDAIFKWNGSPMDEYIYLNESLNNYKVSERLAVEPTDEEGICEENSHDELERFKSNITLAFEIGNDIETLIVDYELYKKLRMVTDGYCVSKNDKEEAVIFVEFIDKILKYGDMKKELLIKDLVGDNFFKLTFKSMNKKFKFERVR